MAAPQPPKSMDIMALMESAQRAVAERQATGAAPPKPKRTFAQARAITAASAAAAAPAPAPAPAAVVVGKVPTTRKPATLAEQAGETLRTLTGINPAGKVPSEDELKEFFKKRKKHPELYTIDPKGNLVVKDKVGAVSKVYTIPPYHPPTSEDLLQLEGERRNAIRDLEVRYEEALTELRARTAEYKAGLGSAGDVVAANKRVMDLDAERHMAAYPLRNVVEIEGVDVNKVRFDQRDDTTKMTVVRPIHRTLTLQEQYAREGEEVLPEPPVEAAQTGGAAQADPNFSETLANDKGIIAFANPEDNAYGFLSTFWPVEFTMDGTRYFTVEQAVAAEKARAFMEDALRTDILKTRAPRTMRTKANAIIPKSISETGGIPVPRLDEWEGDMRLKVLKKATLEKFRQHPELADKLLLTGDKALVLADTREKKDGIGLSLTDPKIANSAEWKGANLYGKILMEVRTAIRDDRGDDLNDQFGGVIEDETITEVAYARERERSERGAVIHAMHARRPHF